MNTFNLIVDDEGFYVWNGGVDLRNNRRITHVRVEDTVTVIPSRAFYHCTKLKEIQLPSGLIRLEGGCFLNCISLKRILIPDSLQEIQHEAFHYSGLEEIKIPPRVIDIQNDVFCGCKALVHVELHDNLQTIGGRSFCGCLSLKKIQFPFSLQRIHQAAFASCGLEQTNLPPDVAVHSYAFRNCKQLTTIILPQSMGRIEFNVFYGCCNICIIQLTTTTVKETLWKKLKKMIFPPSICRNQTSSFLHPTNSHDLQLTTTTTPVRKIKLIAAEQKLITELCRTDGRSSMDRIGMDRKQTLEEYRFFYENDTNSTVQSSCLFTFLKQNCARVSKVFRHGT